MVTLTEIAEALNLDPKRGKTDFSTYGKVISVNPDNTYQVSLNGSDTTVKCARLTGAKVGDVVLVTVLQNGYAVVTGCVGGDTEAQDAQATADGTAQYFWYDTDGAHVTEIPKDDFITTPSGGNLLMQSGGIQVRDGQVVLAEYGANGAQIGKNSGKYVHVNGTQITFYQGSTNSAYIMADYAAQNDRLDFQYYGGHMYLYDNGLEVSKGLAVDGKARLGALDPGIFVTESAQLFASLNIAANGHEFSTVAVSKPGYYPLAIAGWNSPGMRYFVPDRLRLTAQSTGSATVDYDIYNAHTSAHTGSFNVDILWLKVTA